MGLFILFPELVRTQVFLRLEKFAEVGFILKIELVRNFLYALIGVVQQFFGFKMQFLVYQLQGSEPGHFLKPATEYRTAVIAFFKKIVDDCLFQVMMVDILPEGHNKLVSFLSKHGVLLQQYDLAEYGRKKVQEVGAVVLVPYQFAHQYIKLLEFSFVEMNKPRLVIKLLVIN